MVIDTAGPDLVVVTEWRLVWLAVEATVAFCVRKGNGGTIKVKSESFKSRPNVNSTD